MPDSTVVRRARTDDVTAVAKIWYEGWRDGHLGNVDEELVRVRTPESFHERAAARVDDTLVITVGEKVAGFVMVVADEVEQVYVGRPHRGTDVSPRLLSAAEAQVGKSGHDIAWLAVVPGNERARRFYRRCGWTDKGPFDYTAQVGTGTTVIPAHRYTKVLNG
ncbi:MAG TPA: GNAT family N-acetyltransferase [Candidatus Stackebrandtia excrementipullorum]|nr:GNAT family N-acetyltransferase [Candidatus Stackebrandtia excrementipullorum]